MSVPPPVRQAVEDLTEPLEAKESRAGLGCALWLVLAGTGLVAGGTWLGLDVWGYLKWGLLLLVVSLVVTVALFSLEDSMVRKRAREFNRLYPHGSPERAAALVAVADKAEASSSPRLLKDFQKAIGGTPKGGPTEPADATLKAALPAASPKLPVPQMPAPGAVPPPSPYIPLELEPHTPDEKEPGK